MMKNSAPKIILDKFEEYCNPRTCIAIDRRIFFTRNQILGDRIDNHPTNLRLSAKHCEFGNLFEGLINDQIICGIYKKAAFAAMQRNFCHLHRNNSKLPKAIQS